MVNKTISTIFFITLSLQAFSVTHIECTSSDTTERNVSIAADVISPKELKNVSFFYKWHNTEEWNQKVDSIKGVEDAWEMSPQAGTRFYFHSGNTSEFLIIENGVLDSVLNIHGAHFLANEIFESYEEGGYQIVSSLKCSTL